MKESGLGRSLGPYPSLAQSRSLNGQHSSGIFAKIAARVVNEFSHGNSETYYDDVVSYSSVALCKNDVFRDLLLHQDHVCGDSEQQQEDGDIDFEFAVPGVGEYSSPISADDVFHNGQIKPLFPVFKTNLARADTYRVNSENRSILPQSRSPAPEVEKNSNSKSLEKIPVRLPLKKLMISERETSLTESASCSCSEADELEGVAPETYCVWAPNKNVMKKKSQSTGSSKRWKFRDLLYRSHNDGGDALHLSTSKRRNDQKKDRHMDSVKRSITGDGRMKKKSTGESDRKMSYLVAWFANMNGLSRTVQPF